ncbi:hypothetical protein T492DRAFT_891353 [Pavlovales sp. CCMP2436]|nr:hypothetical protein T492DRAFT_891353 [Pavlovales sp. CCMP2436]
MAAAQIPLEQALQNLFTVERTNTQGLEKLGGATYIHWLCKEIHGSPAEGVDRSTVRQLLEVAKRLWNRCLHEAKGASGARPLTALNAAVRTLALIAMSVALQHPELRLFGDDEKKRTAFNLCKLAHEFATELDDVQCAGRCCAVAQELLDGCSAERVIFQRAHVLCACTRLSLLREDGETLVAQLHEVTELLCSERSPADALQYVELAGLLVQVARSSISFAQAPSPARATLLVHVFDAALRVCKTGLSLCASATMAGASAELTRMQTAARLLQAVLWADLPDEQLMSRALDQLLGLPASKQREPLVQLCISKVLGRLGRAADATYRTLDVVQECDDFDTCFAAAQLLEHEGQHEAKCEALRSIAERKLDRGDERFLALHTAVRDSERALLLLDESLAAHQQGEHVLSSEVMAFIYAYLYQEFASEFERGTHLEAAAQYAAKSKRLNAWRMAAWSHLKLGQHAQALAFARRAVTEDPATNFLFVLAAAGLSRSGGLDGPEADMSEVLPALDSLLEATNYDSSCLEVLSSSALEEGHTRLVVEMLSRWLQKGPPAAANGKLLACLQQLHRLEMGGRDASALNAAEARTIGAHVRAAVSRLSVLGADAAHGSQEEVWWTAALTWNLSLRSRALGDHQLMLECLHAALVLSEWLESGARQLRFSFECHELFACELSAHLDASLSTNQPHIDPERLGRAANQAHSHAASALRMHDALGPKVEHLADAEEGAEAPADTGEHSSAERAAAVARVRSRLATIELEMQLIAHAFPSKGAQTLTAAQLASRLDEVAAGGAAGKLTAEQLEHLAQRSLSLEARVHGLSAFSAHAYRRSCEAYLDQLEGGLLMASERSDPLVRLCHCVQLLSERLSDAEASLDADLRAKYGAMLAAAETRPASRPPGWTELLEWLVDKSLRWSSRASRVDKLVAAEAWMSRAINLQAALLTCVEPTRRAAEEEVLVKSLQPKYDQLLATISKAGASPGHFSSPLKPAHMLLQSANM